MGRAKPTSCRHCGERGGGTFALGATSPAAPVGYSAPGGTGNRPGLPRRAPRHRGGADSGSGKYWQPGNRGCRSGSRGRCSCGRRTESCRCRRCATSRPAPPGQPFRPVPSPGRWGHRPGKCMLQARSPSRVNHECTQRAAAATEAERGSPDPQPLRRKGGMGKSAGACLGGAAAAGDSRAPAPPESLRGPAKLLRIVVRRDTNFRPGVLVAAGSGKGPLPANRTAMGPELPEAPPPGCPFVLPCSNVAQVRRRLGPRWQSAAATPLFE
jgi:hypothetical protein